MQNERLITEARAKEPPLDYAMARCLDAWQDLSTCRPIGMAVGPIPWTAIVAWCEFHELDREITAVVVHVIRTLDIQRAVAERAKQALKEKRR